MTVNAHGTDDQGRRRGPGREWRLPLPRPSALAALVPAGLLALAGTHAVDVVDAVTQPLHEGAHRVEFVVQDGLPWGITQETVDAAVAEDPPTADVPMKVVVSDRYFTLEEVHGEAELPNGADVEITVHRDYADHMDPDFPEEAPKFIGAAVDKRAGAAVDAIGTGEWTMRSAIVDDLFGNFLRGQGPTAVVDAVDRGTEFARGGTYTEGLLGEIGKAVHYLALAALTGVGVLMLRRYEQERQRALHGAQAEFARVLLDEESLDLSLALAGEQRGGRSVAREARALADTLPELVRQDERLRRLQESGRLHWAPRRDQIADFRDRVEDRRLEVEALEGHAETLLQTANGRTAQRHAAAPLARHLAALQAQLQDLPSWLAPQDLPRRLQEAADGLAALTGDGIPADETAPQRQARWEQAEAAVDAVLARLEAHLRTVPGMSAVLTAKSDDGSLVMPASARRRRSSLGLRAWPAGTSAQRLERLRRALGALGGTPLPASSPIGDAAAGGGRVPRVMRWAERLCLVRPGDPAQGRAPRLRKRAWISAALALSVLAAAPVDLLAAGLSTVRGVSWEPAPGVPAGSLIVDGDSSGLDLDAARVKELVDGRFPWEADVVVAVRDADDYLMPPHEPQARVDVEASVIRGTLRLGTPVPNPEDWEDPDQLDYTLVSEDGLLDGEEQLRREFPERIDPASGELLPGQAILPVFRVGEDHVVVLPLMSADRNGPGQDDPVFKSKTEIGQEAHLSVYEDVLDGVEAGVAQGSPRTDGGVYLDEFAGRSLGSQKDIMVGAVTLLGLAGLALLQYLATSASGLRGLASLGRDGRRLRRIRRRLGALFLREDVSRIDSEAVLGAGRIGSAQEAGQRLFERELVLAWRRSESLGDLSLSERWAGDARPVLQDLEDTVEVLEKREERISGLAEETLHRR